MDQVFNNHVPQARPTHEADLIGYRELACLLGVPIGTCYAWVHQRRVPHIRLGPRLVRFSRREIRDWLRQRQVPTSFDPNRT